MQNRPMLPTPDEYVGYTRGNAPRLQWKGKHRTWTIMERQGTALFDQFTILSSPIPAEDNEAGQYEDGQYPDMNSAYEALLIAENMDNGSHMED